MEFEVVKTIMELVFKATEFLYPSRVKRSFSFMEKQRLAKGHMN